MKRRSFGKLALAAGTVLVMAACSGGSGANSGTNSADAVDGPPQSGGTLRAITITEPRSFAPIDQTNSTTGAVIAANGVYGALIMDDPETGEVSYQMAEDLVVVDDGSTLDLKIKPGIEFTDGTPFNAEAVKYNWEQLLAPTGGSTTRAFVNMIESMEVVDDVTLRLNMVEPTPSYGKVISSSNMNWIASPTALAQGVEAFNANPVGAGPFVLSKWMRQDSMTLTRNPDYFDDEGPYLDEIVVKIEPQNSQRGNILMTDQADISMETNAGTYADMQAAGLQILGGYLDGSQVYNFNMDSAPFDDPRAREAVLAGIDLDQINLATYNGAADVPSTFFVENSPYFEDIPLAQYNPERAQELLDELAAEGKPLSFRITSVPTNDARVPAESIQTQLSTLDNVNVEVEIVDFAQMSSRSAARDYDAIVSGAMGNDPEVSIAKYGSGGATTTDDEQLDEAIREGRHALTIEERKAAYKKAQERLAEVRPAIWYVRGLGGIVAQTDVQGIQYYGNYSINPVGIWLSS